MCKALVGSIEGDGGVKESNQHMNRRFEEGQFYMQGLAESCREQAIIVCSAAMVRQWTSLDMVLLWFCLTEVLPTTLE